ncbi:hypothetical protein KXW34_008189, partial [Aspergillus fumigatus]
CTYFAVRSLGHELFGLLGRIPKLKQCLIECERNSTYKRDDTSKPGEHRDPSGMLPGSLSFFPDVGSLYPFQFLEALEVFQASTNPIVIPELPALRKLAISYSDFYCDLGYVEVNLSRLPQLSTF